LTNFNKISEYQISRKFTQLKLSWYMRADRRMDWWNRYNKANRCFSWPRRRT